MNKILLGPIRSSLTASFSFGDIKQIAGVETFMLASPYLLFANIAFATHEPLAL
jgi:hypothetical protein